VMPHVLVNAWNPLAFTAKALLSCSEERLRSAGEGIESPSTCRDVVTVGQRDIVAPGYTVLNETDAGVVRPILKDEGSATAIAQPYSRQFRLGRDWKGEVGVRWETTEVGNDVLRDLVWCALVEDTIA
jgi:hypothetical protein